MKPLPEHGGNVYAAARATGLRLDRLVDFSASINPLGPSPRALRAIVATLPQTIHYPDPDCVVLRKALAARHRLAPDHFLIANGSSELIHLLPRALAIRHALIVGPTFSEYARAVAVEGGQVIQMNAKRAEEYQPPIQRALVAIRTSRPKVDTVFLCNPNSPTGRAVSADEVLRLIEVACKHGAWVVVDETFVEYCEERSALSKVIHSANLLILRSFTKFYALPGIRIGYLAGPTQILQGIRERQPPWSVNTLAQAAALAALEDQPHARRSLMFMQRERLRLASMLESLPGVTVCPSTANFLLVELPSFMTASRLANALRQQGLLIRDCSTVPGLNTRTVRVAVRTPGQNRRLITALHHLLKR